MMTNIVEGGVMLYARHGERIASFKQQSGMATLITAALLLLVVTLMTLASAGIGVTEQRIAANDYRAKQAIEAAQAGLERALHNANTGVSINAGSGSAFGPTVSGSLDNSAVTHYSYSYAYPLAAPGASNVALLSVRSTGYSDDGSGVKTIAQLFKRHAYSPDIPDDPARTGGNYQSNSNSIDINNTVGPIALRAQGTIDTHDKDITSAVGGAGMAPNSSTAGITGVVSTDTERTIFFRDVFGTTKEDIKEQSLLINCNGQCNAALGNSAPPDGQEYGEPKAPLIWVTGNTTLNSQTVIGTPTKPVLLVIEGNLDIGGGVEFYGFIYVIGAVGGSSGGGNTTINGALVCEGDMNLNGNVTINYTKFDPGSDDEEGPALYVKISGTWTD